MSKKPELERLIKKKTNWYAQRTSLYEGMHVEYFEDSERPYSSWIPLNATNEQDALWAAEWLKEYNIHCFSDLPADIQKVLRPWLAEVDPLIAASTQSEIEALCREHDEQREALTPREYFDCLFTLTNTMLRAGSGPASLVPPLARATLDKLLAAAGLPKHNPEINNN